MKTLNKTIAIALALMFTINTLFMLTPSVSAQNDTKTTYAYIGAIPNPVNVGGEVLLHFGTTDAVGLIGNGWKDMTITVTKPDGSKVTLGPFMTDSTGGSGTVYVPDEVGNYTLQTHFPQQNFTSSGFGGSGRPTTYLASDSEELTLEVIQGEINYYPGVPLPEEYWTRPIDPQFREWYTVSGSWLSDPSSLQNLYAPYNDGPETAHILWHKPLTLGGLVGGDVALESSINSGPVGYETGDAYQGKWTSRFIISGILIYTHHTSVRPLEYTAVNLRTGEELWTKTFLDNRSISMCQTYYFESYNYMGTYSYIWVTQGSNWYGFDPFDATLKLTITNVPSGTTVVGERGDIYRYSYSSGQRRFMLWNLSALISMEGSFLSPGPSAYDAGGSNPTTTAQRRAWALNFTLPEGTYTGSIQQVYLGDRIIGGNLAQDAVDLWGISLKAGQEGQALFNNKWTPPAYWKQGNVTISGFGGGWMAMSQESKVAVMWIKETREHYGFSLETGKNLWGPTEPQYYLDSVDDSSAYVRNIAYDKLYVASVSGIVYCYDVQTGEKLWEYYAEEPYTEYLFADTWWMKPMFITDDKIYLGHCEHSANQPLPRDAPFICLNATTGEVIWRVNGMFRQTRWGGRAIIGDSVIATMDTYDQQIWAIGKGPSAMKVSAPGTSVTAGNSIVISGSVTDNSPGTEGSDITLRFPNGVPAIADANQSAWMRYVYKQFPFPQDVTGVEVTLSTIDPNGNYIDLGTTTSDASGSFGFQWETPNVPGMYAITASFAGSEAYFPSSAKTFAVVAAAPDPTAAPTETPITVSEAYFIPAIAGLFVTIIVIGALILLMLKKRP
jgi:outer membrane protein assembly factor BamB